MASVPSPPIPLETHVAVLAPSADTPLALTPVPEPSMLYIVGFFLVAFGVLRMRLRRE